MAERSPVPAVILAGGAARRMGGGDKCRRVVAGQTLLDRVIARLRPQVGPIALNANGDPGRFADTGLPVLPDSLPDRPGPLAGVLAGMDWAAGLGAEKVLTIAADTPFFPDDLAERLAAADAPIALAASPDASGRLRRQPTFGLWDVSLRDDLETALRSGLRKIVEWTDRHGAVSVRFDPVDGTDPFFNINTPAELLRAARLAGSAPVLFGVAGWKNSGKTGLVERLVTELTGRGLRISTVKHAHHSFDVDQPGRDSHRHRQAGATEVLLVSRNRWALMHELRDADEPSLEALLSRLSPADLVLIEGYKTSGHPKIEAHRADTGQDLIAPGDPTILAVASDSAARVAPELAGRRVFDLDDTQAIADFVLEHSTRP